MSTEIIEIHTSDRGTFKRCRRKFGWGSTLRRNLVPIGPEGEATFLGTGVHFALEDWWGYRRFDHPALAFAAYYDAHKPDDRPDRDEEVLDLATGMLDYYVTDWLEEHPEPWETLWVDGKPQVEVEVAVDITQLLRERAYVVGGPSREAALDGHLAGREVHYIMTFDRVVIDKHERILGVDYKTAKQFDELNLQTNPQAGAYDWGMDLFYTPAGYKPEGIIWQQHKKTVPDEPKWVKGKKKSDGMVISTDQRQATTFRKYRRALLDAYGTIPERYQSFLADLAEAQDDYGDDFIRRDILRRNQKQREVEQTKIVQEVLEMLDPALPLYPNPTKDCSWDCSFKAACLAADDGSDPEFFLKQGFKAWAGYKDDWRARVKYPATTSKA